MCFLLERIITRAHIVGYKCKCFIKWNPLYLLNTSFLLSVNQGDQGYPAKNTSLADGFFLKIFLLNYFYGYTSYTTDTYTTRVQRIITFLYIVFKRG